MNEDPSKNFSDSWVKKKQRTTALWGCYAHPVVRFFVNNH